MIAVRDRYNTSHQHSKIRKKGNPGLTLMIYKDPKIKRSKKKSKTFSIFFSFFSFSFFIFLLVVVEKYNFLLNKPVMSFGGRPASSCELWMAVHVLVWWCQHSVAPSGGEPLVMQYSCSVPASYLRRHSTQIGPLQQVQFHLITLSPVC